MAKKKAVKQSAVVPPKRRTCGALQQHYYLLETFPAFRTNQIALEHATQARLRSPVARAGPYKITVVVHVVHNPATPSEKISAAQVNSQIAVLNRDYRGTNSDKSKVPAVLRRALLADPMVEFALATKDPDGKPTNGITYTETHQTSFGDSGNPVKTTAKGGIPPWDTKKYLNIWVCTLGGGLLGYAQFPGGPAKSDGVVILNTAFGTNGSATAPFNLGRSATHEIGHFLNLHHIWGDLPNCNGDDMVADTPGAEAPNFGKPTWPHISCSNGPNGDMFMNYMDYVDDDSMLMFTPGQVSRMQATLDGPRKSLVT